MRIGFDAKRVFRNNTGLGNYSRTLLEGLASTNSHELFLFKSLRSSVYDDWATSNPFHLIEGRGEWFRQFGVDKKVKELNLDLYHGLSNELPLGLSKTLPKVVTIHDVIFLRYPQMYKAWDRRIYYRKTKSAIERAQVVVALSEVTKQDLIKFFNCPEEKIQVVYQSPSIGFELKNSIPPPNKQLLCVSSFQKRKNIPALIRAFDSLQSDWTLILAGRRGDHYEKVMRLVDKSTAKIEVLDSLSDHQLKSLYQKSEAFVFPSLYEGFGLPIAEAMLNGLPILTTKGTSMQEVAGESALYFDPNDKESLKNQLKYLLESEPLRNQLRTAIKKESCKFQIETYIQKMESIYQSVL